MTGYGWIDAPRAVREQVTECVEALDSLLDQDLVGVYLYGSLAIGCFNSDRSDVDPLVVTHKNMTADAKKRLAELLLRLSNAPARMEVSILTTKILPGGTRRRTIFISARSGERGTNKHCASASGRGGGYLRGLIPTCEPYDGS